MPEKILGEPTFPDIFPHEILAKFQIQHESETESDALKQKLTKFNS